MLAAMRAALAILLAVACAGPAAGESEPAGRPATVVSVYDGDTFTARVEVWPGVLVETSVRIVGIDAPEIRGKCDEERRQARAARDELAALLGGRVLLLEIKRDKYAGRVDARVLGADGRDVAEAMLAAGLARAYDGGRREGWCDQGSVP